MRDDKGPDIIELILSACIDAGLDRNVAENIEKEICATYGGRYVYIGKRRRISEDDRKKVFEDGLTNKPTSEIVKSHGISRATLYRYMKKGIK